MRSDPHLSNEIHLATKILKDQFTTFPLFYKARELCWEISYILFCFRNIISTSLALYLKSFLYKVKLEVVPNLLRVRVKKKIVVAICLLLSTEVVLKYDIILLSSNHSQRNEPLCVIYLKIELLQ